jgi:hypothetical protein
LPRGRQERHLTKRSHRKASGRASNALLGHYPESCNLARSVQFCCSKIKQAS